MLVDLEAYKYVVLTIGVVGVSKRNVASCLVCFPCFVAFSLFAQMK